MARNDATQGRVAQVGLLLGMALAALAYAVVGISRSVPSGKPAIVYSHDRRLKTEPCGCSLLPLGGVKNEVALIRRWRNEGISPVSISGGTTFAPEDDRVSSLTPEAWADEAKRTAVALRELGTEVIALGSGDLALDPVFLNRLAAMARARLVSSDLHEESSGKPLFPTSAIVERGDKRLAVLSLSAASPDARQRAGVVRIAPERAIEAALASVPDGTEVVVVAPIDEKTTLELAGKFPRVMAWLGTNAADSWQPVRRLPSGALAGNPTPGGKAVLRLDWNEKGLVGREEPVTEGEPPRAAATP